MASKRKLSCLLIVGIVITAVIVAGYYILTYDIDPPNDADLLVQRLDLPAAENGFQLVNFSVDDFDEETVELLQVDVFAEEFDVAAARKVLTRNAKILDAFDRSLERPGFQVPEIRDFDEAFTYLMPIRNIAQLATVRLRLLLEDGKPTAAFEEALKQVKLGRRLMHGEGVLITYLVGLAVKRFGERNIRSLLTRTALEAADLRSFQERLQPLDVREDAMVRTMQGEYLSAVNTLEDLVEGRIEDLDMGPIKKVPTFLLRPNATRARFAEAFRAMIKNVRLAPMKREPFEVIPKPSLVNYAGDALYFMLVSSIDHFLKNYDQGRLDHTFTLTLMALKRYKQEMGDLPENLTELVPDYMKEVPIDPYDGKPPRYNREKTFLYSVGKDFIDDGGGDLPAATEEDESEEDWDGDSDDPTIMIGF